MKKTFELTPETLAALEALGIKPIEEETQPKKEVWEEFPYYESCVPDGTEVYHSAITGEMRRISKYSNYVGSITRKLAKRQLAEIQLHAISQKWNEGLIEKEDEVYFPIIQYGELVPEVFDNTDQDGSFVSFYFLREKHLIKSIEIHADLWNDWFMI